LAGHATRWDTVPSRKGGKTRTLDLHNLARRALYDYLFPERPQKRERDEESAYVFTSQRAAWVRQQGRSNHLSERGIEHLWMQVKHKETHHASACLRVCASNSYPDHAVACAHLDCHICHDERQKSLEFLL